MTKKGKYREKQSVSCNFTFCRICILWLKHHTAIDNCEKSNKDTAGALVRPAADKNTDKVILMAINTAIPKCIITSGVHLQKINK